MLHTHVCMYVCISVAFRTWINPMVFLALKSSTSQLIERDLAGATTGLRQASAGLRRAASARRRRSRSGDAVGAGGAGGWSSTAPPETIVVTCGYLTITLVASSLCN